MELACESQLDPVSVTRVKASRGPELAQALLALELELVPGLALVWEAESGWLELELGWSGSVLESLLLASGSLRPHWEGW